MEALQFHLNFPRVAMTKALGLIWPGAYHSALAPVRLESVPEPGLPGPQWVRVETVLAGICGSDVKQIALAGATDNPITALISFPHVLGHEAIGAIDSVGPGVQRLNVGERVVVNPWLSCQPRGVNPPCPACQAGDFSLCRSFDTGDLAPGLHLGNNAQLPGAFGPRFVCHESQCFPVPESVTDETAVLADPFAVCLHSVLRNPPPPDGPALVFGLGTLGLLTVAILTRLFPALEVYAIGRYSHQEELARALGAHQVLRGQTRDLVRQIADLVGTRALHPWRGLPWLQDGVGCVYDTIGSPRSVETALRIVRSRGQIVISGVAAPKRLEWTPLYFKEVHITGSNAFGLEPFRGELRHAIEIYLELAREGLNLSNLVTHRFSLDAWREAFRTLARKQASGAVKVVFDFRLGSD